MPTAKELFELNGGTGLTSGQLEDDFGVYIVTGDTETPGNSRFVTLAELAQWVKTAESIVPEDAPLRGARAIRTSNISVSSGFTVFTWQDVDFDTDSIWSVGAPTRLTVPSGVSKVELTASTDTTGGSSGSVYATIQKNGDSELRFASLAINSGFTNTAINLSTGPVAVSPGDYFEIYINSASSSSKNYIAERCFFSMRILEASA